MYECVLLTLQTLATNRPQVIDPAIIRPGRIDEHISIPIPGALVR